jgi:hypothetical protein
MKPGQLPFVMPRFSRMMWVNAAAREAWEGKLTSFAQDWRQLEWLSVVEKVRPCASFWLSQNELAPLALLLEEHGLRARPLLWRERNGQTKKTLLYRVAIGTPKDLRHFRKAWKRGDDDAIGSLLGYPPCCRAFFRKVFVEDGLTDNIWPMAAQSSPGASADRLIEVSGPPELNPFWVQAGIRLTPHYPCRFDCGQSVGLAKAFCEAGRKFGFGKSIDTALEIFRWPVEWSGLHGIAEIRTPILKIATNTDMTDLKRVIQQAGTSFPQEGARGHSFALKPLARGHSLTVLN